MKLGRGIACEENLLGPGVPLFDRLAGCMRICWLHADLGLTLILLRQVTSRAIQ